MVPTRFTSRNTHHCAETAFKTPQLSQVVTIFCTCFPPGRRQQYRRITDFVAWIYPKFVAREQRPVTYQIRNGFLDSLAVVLVPDFHFAFLGAVMKDEFHAQAQPAVRLMLRAEVSAKADVRTEFQNGIRLIRDFVH